MTTKYQLFVPLLDDSGHPREGATDFMRRYEKQRSGEGAGVFVFSTRDELSIARREATDLGFDAETYYIISASNREIADYPGYYLSPMVVEPLGTGERDELNNVQIAKDFDTEALWIDAEVKRLLEPLVPGLSISPRSETVGRTWYAVDELRELPDPLIIPDVRFASPNVGPAEGTFAVQSDGRDVLSDRNIDYLRETGLSGSTRVSSPGADYLIRPRYVVSAAVMKVLVDGGVRGLGELIPLVDIRHPTLGGNV